MTSKTQQIRASNWKGSIPITLSLAPTSLSSPTMPAPLHVMVARTSFLHVALKDSVLRFHKYAPPTISFRGSVVEEPSPGMMSVAEASSDDDNHDAADGNSGSRSGRNKGEESHGNGSGSGHDRSVEGGEQGAGTADSNATAQRRRNHQDQHQHQPCPVCWFEDELTGTPLHWHYHVGVLYDGRSQSSVPPAEGSTSTALLPWKIRLHFTQYPTGKILALDDTLGNNSDGNTNKADVLPHVQRMFKHSLKQALFLEHANSKAALNMTKQAHQQLWTSIVDSNHDTFQTVQDEMNLESTTTTSSGATTQAIPVRICVGTQPPIQKRLERADAAHVTLGQLLRRWAPQYMQQASNDEQPQVAANIAGWKIAGIQPPLSTPVMDLWLLFHHPDHFLYVVLNTT